MTQKRENGLTEISILEIKKLSETLQAIPKSGIVLPYKVYYAFTLNLNKLKPFLDAFRETQNKLFEKYGEKDEKKKLKTKPGVLPGSLEVVMSDKEAFDKEYEELGNVKQKITFYKISLKDLDGKEINGFDGIHLINTYLISNP